MSNTNFTEQKLTITISGGQIDFDFEPKIIADVSKLEAEQQALQGMARVAAGAAHEALTDVVEGAQAAMEARNQG
jgi:hypothetical protein